MICLPIQNYSHNSCPIELPKWFSYLFDEYLKRIEELRSAKQREIFWLIVLVLSGTITLITPWLGPNLLISVMSLILVFTIFRKYLRVNSEVNHVFVNYNVLHHHLMGKLEMGFCNHKYTCNCTNEFRNYVWRKHHISLYNETTVK